MYITFDSAKKANKAEPTLALNPRGDVTRNPKQVYQLPQKRKCVSAQKKYPNSIVVTPIECRETLRGKEYTGTQNKTSSGKTCQQWTAQPSQRAICSSNDLCDFWEDIPGEELKLTGVLGNMG